METAALPGGRRQRAVKVFGGAAITRTSFFSAHCRRPFLAITPAIGTAPQVEFVITVCFTVIDHGRVGYLRLKTKMCFVPVRR